MLGSLLNNSVMAPFASRAEEVASSLRRSDISRALRLLRDAGSPGSGLDLTTDPDALLSGGVALMHIAAGAGAVEVLLELLAMGAEVDCFSADKRTPLHLAVGRGQRGAVQLLLRCGADTSIPDGDGLLAVELTTSPALQRLLMQDGREQAGMGRAMHDLRERIAVNAGALSLRQRQDQTPEATPSATRSNHTPAVELPTLGQLATEGSGVGICEDSSVEAAADDEDLVRSVLEAARETARAFKASSSDYSNTQMVLKCCSTDKPQLLAALARKLQAEPRLAVCRATGGGGNMPDGATPLHVCAGSGNVNALKLLLDGECSAWVRDLQGRTPLHIAAAEKRHEACRLLREAMFRERPLADPVGPNAPVDLTGTTPLGYASFKLDRRPPQQIETELFSPGDRSILPLTPRVRREGSTLKPSVRGAARRADDDAEAAEADMRGAVGEVVYGFSEANGWRPSMEDKMFVRCPLSAVSAFCCLFGVMDGHGGDFCSSYLAECLPAAFEEALRMHPDRNRNSSWSEATLRDALTKAFAVAEGSLRSQPRMQVDVEWTARGGDEARRKKVTAVVDKSGSTAVVCCVTPHLLAVANVGDSRAVLARYRASHTAAAPVGSSASPFEAVPMSRDHKPGDPAERARVEAAGGVVTAVGEGGVFEVGAEGSELRLRMSRAFGDFYLKQREGCGAGEQAVTAEPEVVVAERDPRGGFLILACDGVWDVMSNQDAVDFVADKLGMSVSLSVLATPGSTSGAGVSAAEACDALLLRCLELGTTDNMSAMVVLLGSALPFATRAAPRALTAAATGSESVGVGVGVGCDTPPAGQLLASSSIGSAMRSSEPPPPVDQLAALSLCEEEDSCKKNLTLEFE